MKKLFLLIILALAFTSCRTKQTSIEVSGLVSCEGDNPILVHPFITRLSDGKTFVGDESGHYTVKAVKGDALVFSYVGTISDTIKVENKRLDVKLKLYIPGEDEYAYVDSIRRLQNELTSFVENKDARIGIAVIINGKDTVSINGTKDFPMMSVFKFPLALAVAKWVDANGMSLNDSIAFGPKALIKDTYSPMLKKYGPELYKMSFKELLEWALIESDNNAADLLLKRVGGTACATTLLKDVAGELDITIGASEQEMHKDPYTSYLNRSTPLAMATLFDRFDTDIKARSKSFSDIAVMLEQCRTGVDRLAAPFIATNAVVGHKTGTGFPTPEGRISAINDCGYIHLPNGTRYTIAVFVADSAYDMTETSKIIADISEIVFKSLIESK